LNDVEMTNKGRELEDTELITELGRPVTDGTWENVIIKECLRRILYKLILLKGI